MKCIPLFLKKKMERILCFLDKYANALIAFSACLTTIATFLIWGVSRNQIEVSRAQTKLTSIMGKAAERPVIEIEYISETLGIFAHRNNLRSTVIPVDMEIRTIRLRNTGRGSARKIKIEFRGEKTKEIKEWELGIEIKEWELAVGETREHYIEREKLESSKALPFVKVTYQDIFKNEYITDIFRD